jgi:hypothetical protein
MIKYKEILLFTVVAFGYVSSAHASPFCVQLQGGIAPECIYDDAVLCRQRADQLSGLCVANPKEFKTLTGIGKYCLVDSNRISQCNYTDRSTCATDAQRAGGVCLDATGSTLDQNPYEKDPNVNY